MAKTVKYLDHLPPHPATELVPNNWHTSSGYGVDEAFVVSDVKNYIFLRLLMQVKVPPQAEKQDFTNEIHERMLKGNDAHSKTILDLRRSMQDRYPFLRYNKNLEREFFTEVDTELKEKLKIEGFQNYLQKNLVEGNDKYSYGLDNFHFKEELKDLAKDSINAIWREVKNSGDEIPMDQQIEDLVANDPVISALQNSFDEKLRAQMTRRDYRNKYLSDLYDDMEAVAKRHAETMGLEDMRQELEKEMDQNRYSLSKFKKRNQGALVFDEKGNAHSADFLDSMKEGEKAYVYSLQDGQMHEFIRAHIHARRNYDIVHPIYQRTVADAKVSPEKNFHAIADAVENMYQTLKKADKYVWGSKEYANMKSSVKELRNTLRKLEGQRGEQQIEQLKSLASQVNDVHNKVDIYLNFKNEQEKEKEHSGTALKRIEAARIVLRGINSIETSGMLRMPSDEKYISNNSAAHDVSAPLERYLRVMRVQNPDVIDNAIRDVNFVPKFFEKNVSFENQKALENKTMVAKVITSAVMQKYPDPDSLKAGRALTNALQDRDLVRRLSEIIRQNNHSLSNKQSLKEFETAVKEVAKEANMKLSSAKPKAAEKAPANNAQEPPVRAAQNAPGRQIDVPKL